MFTKLTLERTLDLTILPLALLDEVFSVPIKYFFYLLARET